MQPHYSLICGKSMQLIAWHIHSTIHLKANYISFFHLYIKKWSDVSVTRCSICSPLAALLVRVYYSEILLCTTTMLKTVFEKGENHSKLVPLVCASSYYTTKHGTHTYRLQNSNSCIMYKQLANRCVCAYFLHSEENGALDGILV